MMYIGEMEPILLNRSFDKVFDFILKSGEYCNIYSENGKNIEKIFQRYK